jgi:hypothetical protein
MMKKARRVVVEGMVRFKIQARPAVLTALSI